MATAGYSATVSVTGTSTATANEPMSDIGGGTKLVWQVTDAAKQVMDPAVAFVLRDNDTGLAYAHPFSIDYLTGTVVLSVAVVAAPDLSYNYLPVRQITNAYEVSASLARNLADTNVLGFDYAQRTPTLFDITGSLSCYDNGLTVYTDVALAVALDDGLPKLIEIDASGGSVLRFFALFESVELSSSPDGVQEISASFSGDSQKALTTGQEVDFSWT